MHSVNARKQYLYRRKPEKDGKRYPGCLGNGGGGGGGVLMHIPYMIRERHQAVTLIKRMEFIIG